MNTNSTPNQDIYSAILAVWSILAASAVMMIDQQTFILALALLVMIVIFTITRPFPYSSVFSTLAGAVVYLAVYFGIFPFSLASLTVPASVVVIFAATAGVVTFVMRRINSGVGRLHTNLQLLSDLVPYDPETGLLLWQHARQRLETELARCRRYQKSFSLIMLEPANTADESLGDEARKELNRRITKLLVQTCRTDVDTPFTGHHFGVILPETEAAGAEKFAGRLQANSVQILLDLRIAVVSFPTDGVTSDELITACETALQAAIATEQTIVRYDSLKKTEALDVVAPNEPEPAPKKTNDYLGTLEPHEYLLTFLEFGNMADIPLVQENLKNIQEIDHFTLLEYSKGRLVFKLASKAALLDQQFSNLSGLHVKAIRTAGNSIEIDLDK
ncbi:MAG: diguanylate cyclase [Anaerolineaceae bacterium]|jgi:GGDEF domain-containing protein